MATSSADILKEAFLEAGGTEEFFKTVHLDWIDGSALKDKVSEIVVAPEPKIRAERLLDEIRKKAPWGCK